MIPPVRDAGYRCIAPDYAGFGRSDKPTDLGWYSYDRHVELMESLLSGLGLSDATAVVHDWGGPIGLRMAVEHPDWFSRMVVMDTGLFTGEQPMTDAWRQFRDFVERTEDIPVSMLVKGACSPGRRGTTRGRPPYSALHPTPDPRRAAHGPPDAADVPRHAPAPKCARTPQSHA